jgi:N-alpha-acetyl-L-2,4-diaminobutyrate deacetylase
MTRKSTAFTSLDYECGGKQLGFVNIPHSPHEDAWGVTPVPIGIVRNGSGPTVIIQGGNHGDEYEGQIAIGELMRDLDPTEVRGRLILVPSLNVAAVDAARRTSPVDGLNLNRTFPGDPIGTITQQLSAYVNDVLFPLADAFIDLHSGGSSLSILPSAIIEPAEDPELHRRNVAAVFAFGAPLAVVLNNLGDPRTSTASSVRAGLVTVGTEMAGAGTVSIEALRLCRRGIRNVLAHLGVLDSRHAEPSAEASRLLMLGGPKAYVYATSDGVFEPFHELGTTVEEGMPAGRIHFTTTPASEPEALVYSTSGLLYGRRQPGRVRPGNCCLVVASEYSGSLP